MRAAPLVEQSECNFTSAKVWTQPSKNSAKMHRLSILFEGLINLISENFPK